MIKLAVTLLICFFSLAFIDWFLNRRYYSRDGLGLWQDTRNQLRRRYRQHKAQKKEYQRLMLKADTWDMIFWLKLSIICEDMGMHTIRNLVIIDEEI